MLIIAVLWNLDGPKGAKTFQTVKPEVSLDFLKVAALYRLL